MEKGGKKAGNFIYKLVGSWQDGSADKERVVTMPEDMSSIPGNHVVGRKKKLLQVVLCPHM